MTRTRLLLCLFGAAILCGGMFFFISDATVVPMIAKGTGPGGVQVTTGGWVAFLASLLGTCGFSLTGLIVWIAGHFHCPAPAVAADDDSGPSKPTDPFLAEIVELTESFGTLIGQQDNRAAQRRFVFALVDAAGLIKGCQTSHENGVVVIKYSGYADPVTPAQGEKS